jgi:hypothetical protein
MALQTKRDELIQSFETDGINPHILFISELRIVEQDLLFLSLPSFY